MDFLGTINAVNAKGYCTLLYQKINPKLFATLENHVTGNSDTEVAALQTHTAILACVCRASVYNDSIQTSTFMNFMIQIPPFNISEIHRDLLV